MPCLAKSFCPGKTMPTGMTMMVTILRETFLYIYVACFWFIMGFSLPTIMTSVQILQDTMQADIHAVSAASFQKSSSSPTL